MTQINISKKRRLEIKCVVYNALVHSGLCSLPIKIKAIVRSYPHVRLISFSKHIKRLNISYEEMKKYAKTKDAFTDYYVSKKMYYIYYNDLDINIVTSNRYRWNIAHELGHILLEHHKNNIKTRIFRCSLSDKEYNILEAEADYFAQLLLVPHAVLIEFRIKNSNHIKLMCKISEPASRRRYYDYILWKNNVHSDDEYDNQIFRYYYNFIFKRHCRNCSSYLIQRYGKYCPICGQKNTLEWSDEKMNYFKLETHENGKLKECPQCQNEETAIEGEFCQICGIHLVNHCTNNSCNYITLPSNARYCPICGHESSFYQNNILKSWNCSIIDEDLPFI